MRIVVACLGLMMASVGAQERFEFRKVIMASEARVVLFAENEDEAAKAADAAFARMEALDAVMSDQLEDSQLRQLNEGAGEGPMPISADLFEVLSRAKEIATLSGGAFDCTVGPLVALWRLAKADGKSASAEELATARALVGNDKLVLDPDKRTAQLMLAGMKLDLGGIGKGFAADKALAVLNELGHKAALVELGGDIVVGEAPPSEKGWLIECGCAETGAQPLPERIVNGAVASSGARYRSRVDADGKKRSHIVDPRNLEGASGIPDRGCVTVVARDGTAADALVTMASILGPREARLIIGKIAGARAHIQDPEMVAIFDGKSLDGLVTKGGRYDGDAAWSVEDGAIVGRVGKDGAGGLLYSKESYRDVAVELEFAIDFPFDSGVFLRMAPEGKGAQVTLDYREGGEVGAIYSDGFLVHNEDAKAQVRAGAWHHLEVRCSGEPMYIQAWLDGVPIADYQLPEGTEGYAPEGRIGLQVHGDRDDPPGNAVRFRNVWVKKLNVTESTEAK